MSKAFDLPDIPTMGIEEEHFTVSTKSGQLSTLTPEVIGKLSDALGSAFTPEYKSCQIELRSSPTVSGDDLIAEINKNRKIANDVLSNFDLKLFSYSTHPTANWKDHKARPDPRYAKIESRLGESVRRLLVAGLHIHIGTFSDTDTPIKRMSQFWFVTPTLIAANASSSDWSGRQTGFVSHRRNILLGLSSQCPPPVRTRKEYDEYLKLQIALNAADEESDLWLDIRPGREGLNTVEFRATDMSPDAICNVSLAIFLQGLEFVARISPRSFPELPGAYARNLIEQSSRLSSKHGFEAQVFDPFRGSARNLKDFSLELLDLAKPGISASGNGSWFPKIKSLLNQENLTENVKLTKHSNGD